MYKPPFLQKYAGKSTRFTCPNCKTPFSFTRYLDGETHQPIHPTVGRCNREIKCGYHYTPCQYFTDRKRQGYHAPTTNHFNQSYPDLHSPISPISPISPQPPVPRRLQSYPEPRDPFPLPQPNQSQKQPDYIPHKYLKRSLSLDSNFVRFLREHFSDLQIAEAVNNYLLGATIKKEVIFWQIDINGKIRTGKIMKYNPQTGHRLKSGYNTEVTKTFFVSLINSLVYELYFPEEIKSADKEILKHLGDLKPITDDMSEEEKLAIIQSEFERLYDPNHPVRFAIETLDSVEEVRIIKEALK